MAARICKQLRHDTAHLWTADVPIVQLRVRPYEHNSTESSNVACQQKTLPDVMTVITFQVAVRTASLCTYVLVVRQSLSIVAYVL